MNVFVTWPYDESLESDISRRRWYSSPSLAIRTQTVAGNRATASSKPLSSRPRTKARLSNSLHSAVIQIHRISQTVNDSLTLVSKASHTRHVLPLYVTAARQRGQKAADVELLSLVTLTSLRHRQHHWHHHRLETLWHQRQHGQVPLRCLPDTGWDNSNLNYQLNDCLLHLLDVWNSDRTCHPQTSSTRRSFDMKQRLTENVHTGNRG